MTAEHTRLTAALRELRARTGLSLAALSERTAYSKSSWERYLNGKSLPPRQAVQELCRVADESDGRLLALWEIAESEWSGRAAVPALVPVSAPAPALAPTPASTPAFASAADEPRPRRRRGRLMVVLAAVYAMLVGGVALVLFLLLEGQGNRGDPGDSGNSGNGEALKDEPLSASAAPYSLAPQCHGAACEGRDPMRLVCGIGPDTLAAYRTATGAHMELRYSKKCGASWARVWGTRIGDQVEVTVGGPIRDVRIKNKVDTETYVYTKMTEAHPGSLVRACFRPASADGERECVEARVGEATTTNRPPSPP